jgi:hypothetical protein
LRKAGHYLSRANYLALQEARCRSRIAEVIGKPAALAFRLRMSSTRSLAEVSFIAAASVDHETAIALQDVPGLIVPIE